MEDKMIRGETSPSPGASQSVQELNTILPRQSVVDVEIPIKGLLVRESVVVCDSSQDQVEAHCSNISHFCTGTYEYPIYVKPGGTAKALTCRLSDIVAFSGKLLMKDFHLMEDVWIDRECERVQPKEPVFVTVQSGVQKTRANLFDLSLSGMCVLIDNKFLPGRRSLINRKLKITMKLPCSRTACQIKGTVVQVRPISDHLVRVGMNISMSKKDEGVIAHYLTERKREILDELFLNFMQLLHHRETKDQYF